MLARCTKLLTYKITANHNHETTVVTAFKNYVKFELLNDFPLEKINAASSMLVLPDPFEP